MSNLRSIGAALGLAGMLIAPTVTANLIENGSFEQALILDQSNGGWGYFLPSDVDGWDSDTNKIEIWDSGFNGVIAADGQRFAELNAHPETSGNAFTLFQEIDTIVNQIYHLTFAYRARVGNETFNVAAGNLALNIDNSNTDDWSVFSGMFMALSETTKLQFTSVNPTTNTLGNFIDNVSIVAKVPEPGTLGLLGLGLVGLGIARKRKA
jgi:hypothetical protein